ncbi:MAG TPA: hypothetical protein VF626_02505 [Chthoniobacterales bacterium]|jgi:hypothetical protein
MKTILTTVLTLAFAASTFPSQRFDAAAWRSVQTYDVSTLLKQEASLVGKIVGVRFNYRSKKLRGIRPSWYEASIWQHDPNAKKGFSGLRVIVAKKDKAAFESITSDFRSAEALTIYGRIEHEPDNNLAQLRVIGRKAEVDSSGNATVDW